MITLNRLLVMYQEKVLKPSNLSNGTISAYITAIRMIRSKPIAKKNINVISPTMLQCFFDDMAYGRGQRSYTHSYIQIHYAVLNHAFSYALYPLELIRKNPMSYVNIKYLQTTANIFEKSTSCNAPILTMDQIKLLIKKLNKSNPDAVLPVQIAFYSGLRLGEVCALSWQDIDFNNNSLIVRRSIRYNSVRHQTEVSSPKRGKIRTVYFGDNLKKILLKEKARQVARASAMGTTYYMNFCSSCTVDNRIYYDLVYIRKQELDSSITKVPGTDIPISTLLPLDLVCRRSDGKPELPNTVEYAMASARKSNPALAGIHFHMLRHTYTSMLLEKGASITDVSELLGHSSVTTTLNIYAHSMEGSKKEAVKLLDNI